MTAFQIRKQQLKTIKCPGISLAETESGPQILGLSIQLELWQASGVRQSCLHLYKLV